MMSANSSKNEIPVARRRIARIKCFLDCVKSLQENKPFPEALCYIPSAVEYSAKTNVTWKFYEVPKKNAKVIREVSTNASSRLVASGEDMSNADGRWLKVSKVKATSSDKLEPFTNGPGWLLLYSSLSSTADTPNAIRTADTNQGKQKKKLENWEAYIEKTYSLLLKKDEAEVCPPDDEAIAKLRKLGEGWTSDHDAALVKLMSPDLIQFRNEDNIGCLKDYIESLEVSSYSSGEGEASHLTDEDSSTYWETDGTRGQHWIRLRMRKKTIIKKMVLKTYGSDMDYLPEQIVVLGGESDEVDLKVLNTTDINWDTRDSDDDIVILEDCVKHFPIINIRFKRCKDDGIDVRIRGLELKCEEQRSMGFDMDFFSEKNLVKFPFLQSYSTENLFCRSLVLQRFIWLLDSVIHFLVPVWQHSIDNVPCIEGSIICSLESVRQILPLSKKRLRLIDTLLKSSAADREGRQMVHINRHAAHAHRRNPSASADLSNTVFHQLYQGLHSKDKSDEPLTYRWPAGVSQWWECKFIDEGVIDQGGGFRDSLTDMAEELCPSDPEAPYALPFFIRAPNQENEDGNINKDVYIPNPSCADLAKYEWIGKLMAACFRTKDILILPLASFIWKKLNGESYSWSEDFATIDAAEVKLIDSLVKMDRETFDVSGRSWSLILSDGSSVCLKMDAEGNPKPLAYEDREEYANKVREVRMGECDKQLKAIKSGLLKAVPEAVLNLSTWQELEYRVCGQPEVTIEGLMRSTYYTGIEETDPTVKMFWAAVKNFTNEERSRLLRFITGRSRLPVSIFLSSGKSSPLDQLPESSTCANTLHIPLYSSARACEEKLRYAVYNCVSIDTDE